MSIVGNDCVVGGVSGVSGVDDVDVEGDGDGKDDEVITCVVIFLEPFFYLLFHDEFLRILK